MGKPVIFSCFANDETEHLELLKDESRQINEALQNFEKKELIKLHREESADAEDLVNTFRLYQDSIVIFHYAGHAEGTKLILESGQVLAKGLGGLLAGLPKLKLVFLNGCSTEEQVNTLLNQGVKVIIATSVPINDQKARDFATAFYRALAEQSSIAEAFEHAKGVLQLNHTDSPDININKIRGLAIEDSTITSYSPWGIYVQEKNLSTLEWKLPSDRTVLDDLRDQWRKQQEWLKKKRKPVLAILSILLVLLIGGNFYRNMNAPFRALDQQIINSLDSKDWQDAFAYEDQLVQMIYFSAPDRATFAQSLTRLVYIKLEKGIINETGATELLKLVSLIEDDLTLPKRLRKKSDRFRKAAKQALASNLKTLKYTPATFLTFVNDQNLEKLQSKIDIGQNYPITFPVIDDIRPFLFALGAITAADHIIYTDKNGAVWLKANLLEQERLFDKLTPRVSLPIADGSQWEKTIEQYKSIGKQVEKVFQAINDLNFTSAHHNMDTLLNRSDLDAWAAHCALIGTIAGALSRSGSLTESINQQLTRAVGNEDHVYVSSLIQIINFFKKLASIPQSQLDAYVNALREINISAQGKMTARQGQLINILTQLGPLLEYQQARATNERMPAFMPVFKNPGEDQRKACEDCAERLSATIAKLENLGRKDLIILPKAIRLLNTKDTKTARSLFQELKTILVYNTNPVWNVLLLVKLFPGLLNIHPNLISQDECKVLLDQIIDRLDAISDKDTGGPPMDLGLSIGVALSNLSIYAYGSTKKVTPLLEKYINNSNLSLPIVGSKLMLNWFSMVLNNPDLVLKEMRQFADQITALPIDNRTYTEKQTFAAAHAFKTLDHIFSDQPEKAKEHLSRGLLCLDDTEKDSTYFIHYATKCLFNISGHYLYTQSQEPDKASLFLGEAAKYLNLLLQNSSADFLPETTLPAFNNSTQGQGLYYVANLLSDVLPILIERLNTVKKLDPITTAEQALAILNKYDLEIQPSKESIIESSIVFLVKWAQVIISVKLEDNQGYATFHPRLVQHITQLGDVIKQYPFYQKSELNTVSVDMAIDYLIFLLSNYWSMDEDILNDQLAALFNNQHKAQFIPALLSSFKPIRELQKQVLFGKEEEVVSALLEWQLVSLIRFLQNNTITDGNDPELVYFFTQLVKEQISFVDRSSHSKGMIMLMCENYLLDTYDQNGNLTPSDYKKVIDLGIEKAFIHSFLATALENQDHKSAMVILDALLDQYSESSLEKEIVQLFLGVSQMHNSTDFAADYQQLTAAINQLDSVITEMPPAVSGLISHSLFDTLIAIQLDAITQLGSLMPYGNLQTGFTTVSNKDAWQSGQAGVQSYRYPFLSQHQLLLDLHILRCFKGLASNDPELALTGTEELIRRLPSLFTKGRAAADEQYQESVVWRTASALGWITAYLDLKGEEFLAEELSFLYKELFGEKIKLGDEKYTWLEVIYSDSIPDLLSSMTELHTLVSPIAYAATIRGESTISSLRQGYLKQNLSPLYLTKQEINNYILRKMLDDPATKMADARAAINDNAQVDEYCKAKFNAVYQEESIDIDWLKLLRTNPYNSFNIIPHITELDVRTALISELPIRNWTLIANNYIFRNHLLQTYLSPSSEFSYDDIVKSVLLACTEDAPNIWFQDELFNNLLALQLHKGSSPTQLTVLFSAFAQNCQDQASRNLVGFLELANKYDSQNSKADFQQQLQDFRFKLYPPAYERNIEAFYNSSDQIARSKMANELIQHFIGLQMLNNFGHATNFSLKIPDANILAFFDEFYPMTQGLKLRSGLFQFFINTLQEPSNILASCNRYFAEKISLKEELSKQDILVLFDCHLLAIDKGLCQQIEFDYKKIFRDSPAYLLSYTNFLSSLCTMNESNLKDKKVLEKIYQGLQYTYARTQSAPSQGQLSAVPDIIQSNLLQILGTLNTSHAHHQLKLKAIQRIRDLENRPTFLTPLLEQELDVQLLLKNKPAALGVFKRLLVEFDGLAGEEALKITLFTKKAPFFVDTNEFQAIVERERLKSKLNNFEKLTTTLVTIGD